jgi:hypothetical protein
VFKIQFDKASIKLRLEYSQVCPLSLNNSTKKTMQEVYVKLNPGLPRQHSTRLSFTRQLHLNLRRKPVNCYIWSIVLYEAEIWTLQKVDQKYLESF